MYRQMNSYALPLKLVGSIPHFDSAQTGNRISRSDFTEFYTGLKAAVQQQTIIKVLLSILTFVDALWLIFNLISTRTTS